MRDLKFLVLYEVHTTFSDILQKLVLCFWSDSSELIAQNYVNLADSLFWKAGVPNQSFTFSMKYCRID